MEVVQRGMEVVQRGMEVVQGGARRHGGCPASGKEAWRLSRERQGGMEVVQGGARRLGKPRGEPAGGTVAEGN
eukprot:358460-Chlamydomonas_euryale.AAC.1